MSDALDELERDEVLCNTLGSDYAAAYLETKRAEWDDYHEMTAKSVTAWEVQRYWGLRTDLKGRRDIQDEGASCYDAPSVLFLPAMRGKGF